MCRKSKLEHKLIVFLEKNIWLFCSLFLFWSDQPPHHQKRRGAGKRNILGGWP